MGGSKVNLLAETASVRLKSGVSANAVEELKEAVESAGHLGMGGEVGGVAGGFFGYWQPPWGVRFVIGFGGEGVVRKSCHQKAKQQGQLAISKSEHFCPYLQKIFNIGIILVGGLKEVTRANEFASSSMRTVDSPLFSSIVVKGQLFCCVFVRCSGKWRPEFRMEKLPVGRWDLLQLLP